MIVRLGIQLGSLGVASLIAPWPRVRFAHRCEVGFGDHIPELEGTMDVAQEVHKLVEQRIEALDDEKGRLERTLVHLGEPSGTNEPKPRRRPRGGAGGPQKRTRGRRLAPKGQRREEVLTDIRANPGTKASETAKRLGLSTNNVQGIARKLVAEKAVKKNGTALTAA